VTFDLPYASTVCVSVPCLKANSFDYTFSLLVARPEQLSELTGYRLSNRNEIARLSCRKWAIG
ncbi:hypothetical protein ACEE15_01575, partial [Streptococcus thoraltensis]